MEGQRTNQGYPKTKIHHDSTQGFFRASTWSSSNPRTKILIILSVHILLGAQVRSAQQTPRRIKCRAIPQDKYLQPGSYVTAASISAPAMNVPPARHTAIARNAASVTSPSVLTAEHRYCKAYLEWWYREINVLEIFIASWKRPEADAIKALELSSGVVIAYHSRSESPPSRQIL
jgi:hypothetical protein